MTPDGTFAWAALDQLGAHPELWDESVLIKHDGDKTICCFGTRVVLVAGYAVDENGDVKLADLPEQLADDVRYLLYDDDDAFDPEFPRRLADVSDVAQVLLGISYTQTAALFDVPAERELLDELIELYFGPRPVTDDGLLSMSPPEVAAELAIDRLAQRVSPYEPGLMESLLIQESGIAFAATYGRSL